MGNNIKVGFNYGQMYSYIAFQNGYQNQIPDKLLDKIKAVTPEDWLLNIRFSGTMSNYMNMQELGYGEHKETFQQWLPFSHRVGLLQKVQFLVATLTGNDKKIIQMSKQYVKHSYLYNFARSVEQLNAKGVSFTFNSHMPFRGLHKLEQSLDSLAFIKDNTPLNAVELENEGYFAEYIWRNRLDEYFGYLEDTVVPNIAKVVGDKIPLGVPVAPNTTPRYKRWNERAIRLSVRLKEKGYKPFFVVHAYIDSIDDKGIEKELKGLIDFLPKDFEVRITEFNLNSDSFNKHKIKEQEDVIKFINTFAQVANGLNITEVYYHTLYTREGAHFSFIK